MHSYCRYSFLNWNSTFHCYFLPVSFVLNHPSLSCHIPLSSCPEISWYHYPVSRFSESLKLLLVLDPTNNPSVGRPRWHGSSITCNYAINSVQSAGTVVPWSRGPVSGKFSSQWIAMNSRLKPFRSLFLLTNLICSNEWRAQRNLLYISLGCLLSQKLL